MPALPTQHSDFTRKQSFEIRTHMQRLALSNDQIQLGQNLVVNQFWRSFACVISNLFSVMFGKETLYGGFGRGPLKVFEQ